MKNFVIIVILSFISFSLFGQDCSQNENVIRFMARGKVALKSAEQPEDYKLAANEFLKVLEYDAKCPDVYYQLALCYEQMGKLDPSSYKKAMSYLQTYLSLRPNASDKQEVQEKIYELEFLIEKTGGISLNELVGKWRFYWGTGSADKFFDIEIFENQGNFYAKDVCDLRKLRTLQPDRSGTYNTDKEYEEWKNVKCNNIIKYENGIIYFETEPFIHFWSIYTTSDKRGKWSTGSSKYWELKYTLKFEDGKLVGDRLCTRHEIQEKTFSEMSEDWKKTTDCSGDCGNSKVYFVKQW